MIAKNRNAGFSLLELLVVLSVISMLMSITFTFVAGSREKAHNAITHRVMSQYISAIEQYHIDNGYFPRPTNDGFGGLYVYHCLGNSNNYYDPGKCLIGNTRTNIGLTNALQPYYAHMPLTSVVDVYGFGGAKVKVQGPVYICLDDDTSPCNWARVVWYLHGGNQSCAAGTRVVGLLTQIKNTLNQMNLAAVFIPDWNTSTKCVFTFGANE